MPSVLIPTHINQWTWSVASKLRELIVWSEGSEFDFYTFHKDSTSVEDIQQSRRFWDRPHVHRISSMQILRRNFDIVHHAVPTLKSILAALSVRARSCGHTKHIYSIGSEPYPSDPYFRQMGMGVKMAHSVLANSTAVADGVHSHFGRSVDAIIPNGVDIDFFSPEEADRPTLDHLGIVGPYLLYCGVISYGKRPDIFIQLACRFPTIQFLMIGRQTHEGREIIANAPPNVRYLGLLPKRQVRDILAFAEALIFPSEREGLPNAVLEAISMGIPVLAQPKSSLPDLVLNDVTGWLIPADDLGQWGEHIKEIVNWSGSKREAFGRNARTIAINRYSWKEYSRHHLELYRHVLRH